MRHLALVLCLAACSSDPASTSPDASTIDATPDASPSDVVTVTDAPAEAATPDVSAPEAAVDVALEAATDVAADVAAVVDVPADTSSDTPEASAPRDVAVVDVPRGECAAVERSCRVNADCAMCTPVRGLTWCCGVIGGRSTCAVPLGDGSCPGVVTDAGPVAPDVRVSCTASLLRCTSDTQCQTMCVPRTDGVDWCCSRLNGLCGTTESGSCMR